MIISFKHHSKVKLVIFYSPYSFNTIYIRSVPNSFRVYESFDTKSFGLYHTTLLPKSHIHDCTKWFLFKTTFLILSIYKLNKQTQIITL